MLLRGAFMVSVQPPPLIAESMRQYTCVFVAVPETLRLMVYVPFVLVPVEFLMSRHDCMLLTVRVVVVLAAAYVEVASCEMVIVVVPLPTSVMSLVVSLMVATDVLELVYERAPLLLVEGAVRVNGAVSGVFVIDDSELSIGLLSTTNDAAVLPAAYVEVADTDAVMVVFPPPTIVTRPVVALMVATEVLELVYEIAPSLFVVGAGSVNAASL